MYFIMRHQKKKHIHKRRIRSRVDIPQGRPQDKQLVLADEMSARENPWSRVMLIPWWMALDFSTKYWHIGIRTDQIHNIPILHIRTYVDLSSSHHLIWHKLAHCPSPARYFSSARYIQCFSFIVFLIRCIFIQHRAWVQLLNDKCRMVSIFLTIYELLDTNSND